MGMYLNEKYHIFSPIMFYFKSFFQVRALIIKGCDLCYADCIKLEVGFLLLADNVLERMCSFSFLVSPVALLFHSYKSSVYYTLYWIPSTPWPKLEK